MEQSRERSAVSVEHSDERSAVSVEHSGERSAVSVEHSDERSAVSVEHSRERSAVSVEHSDEHSAVCVEALELMNSSDCDKMKVSVPNFALYQQLASRVFAASSVASRIHPSLLGAKTANAAQLLAGGRPTVRSID